MRPRIAFLALPPGPVVRHRGATSRTGGSGCRGGRRKPDSSRHLSPEGLGLGSSLAISVDRAWRRWVATGEDPALSLADTSTVARSGCCETQTHRVRALSSPMYAAGAWFYRMLLKRSVGLDRCDGARSDVQGHGERRLRRWRPSNLKAGTRCITSQPAASYRVLLLPSGTHSLRP